MYEIFWFIVIALLIKDRMQMGFSLTLSRCGCVALAAAWLGTFPNHTFAIYWLAFTIIVHMYHKHPRLMNGWGYAAIAMLAFPFITAML